MSGPVSMEARAHAAAYLLALDALERRDHLLGEVAQEYPRLPDARTFAADARSAMRFDPAAAALLAEAWLVASMRRPSARYEAALAAKPLALRGEARPIALRAAVSAAVTERNGARREAVLAATDARLRDARDAARDAVDALRDATGALDPALRDALLPNDAEADATLSATEDLWRELDLRATRALELDPARLRWGDRLHALLAPSVATQVPPATWSALSVGWWERVGLDGALRGVRDALSASSREGTGVHVIVTEPGARATLAGRPSPSGWDAGEVFGAGAVAAGSVLARGISPAHRRGVDRVADGALHALGRRLLHDRAFLHRAAQLDAAPRERVMLEALHAEVARVRLDAVLARYTRLALDRAPELGVRFVDDVTRAWGVAPSPGWAVHFAADALASGAPFGGAWGRRAVGSRVEAALRARLRERFDEDWHRNPRSGEWLRGAMDAIRSLGWEAWREAEGIEASADALARRLAEDFAAARR